MGFTRLEYPIFLAIVAVVAWRFSSTQSRHTWLLGASYYFYAFWDYRFCGLLVLSTMVDYAIGRYLDSRHARHRGLALATSLVFNLGLLSTFKYANFFINSATAVLAPMGLGTGSLSVVLPVGISFYTFQTMSYSIDVYRRKIPACRSFLDFALYVSFFPQLVAGPIVRASELMPQLQCTPEFSRRRLYGGLQMILRGAVKKILLADRLGEFVDVVYEGPELYSGGTLLLVSIAYAGQIYYDFSGYSDMAIGSAKVLGYHFPINFRHPYLSTSPSEFWRRWHMTLSRWLKDYLYIPLGGSRSGEKRTTLNLLTTMVLGGLWHGAAWRFVFWGGLHGMALAATRRARWIHQPIVGWLFTIAVVLLGWILFRAETYTDALTVVGGISTWQTGLRWYPPLVLLVLSLMCIDHIAWRTPLRRTMRLPINRWYSPIVTTIAIWCLIAYSPTGYRPFVYFQF
ncbi:MAG: MBOAT family protein [Planctomycetota bacterium]